jgi:hypothetical protein
LLNLDSNDLIAESAFRACEKHMGKPSEEDVKKWVADFLAAVSTMAITVATGGVVSKPLSDAGNRPAAPAPAGPRVAEADKTKKKKTTDSAPAKTSGQQGKLGNVEYLGKYQISIPPSPQGKKFPLVVLFAGNTKIIKMKPQTPDSYYLKAILVFSEKGGSFSDLQSELTQALNENNTSFDTGKVSLCGFSSGGQTAIRNYSSAKHKVGLIDPTLFKSDLTKLDAKTILSLNPNPGNWETVLNPNGENALDGRNAAIQAHKLGKFPGVFATEKKVGHNAYPGFFLSKYETDLI